MHHQWRFGDPLKKSGDPDRHDYEIKVVDGVEVAPGPVWHTFFVAGAIVFRLVQSVRVVKNDALPTTPQGRLPGPVWHSLYRWIISQAADLLAFQTVYLITDNQDLLAATVSSTAGLSHWPMVTAWWKERIGYVGRMVNVPRLCLCLYRQTLVWTRCTQRGRAPTGEAHFCAPAFSYVLRSKNGSLLCHIVLLQFP